MIFFQRLERKYLPTQILSLENILQNYSYVKMFIDKLKDYFACELKEKKHQREFLKQNLNDPKKILAMQEERLKERRCLGR